MSFFNPENELFRFIVRVTDLIGLSLLWIFCATPIVTLGASTTALYDVVIHCVRGDEQNPFARFFHIFRENFKSSTYLSLLYLAVLVPLFLLRNGLLLSANEGNPIAVVLFVAITVALVVPLGGLCWVFPLLARFDFSPAALWRTSLQFVFTHLPTTIVLVVLVLQMTALALQFWFLLFVAPCGVALVSSFMMERAFKKYR